MTDDDLFSDNGRKQRMEERWKRIQAKLYDDNGKNGIQLQEEELPIEVILAEKVKAKLKKYQDQIDTKFFNASQKISDFIKSTDFKESKRKKDYVKQIKQMEAKIEEEQASVKEEQMDLDEKWQDIANIAVPQEMYKAMVHQKREYQKLLDRKITLMKELEDYFYARKEGYTALFKSEEMTVKNIIIKSRAEVAQLKKDIKEKLMQIECSLVEEQRGIVVNKQNEIDEIFEKRREQELTMLDKENEKQIEYFVDLDQLRQDDEEKFKTVKTELTKKIMIMVQDLEDVRAKYQLNYEKLMYNYAILKEREKDNLATVSNQKKRFKRLRETLANAKNKYETLDKEFQKKNNQLSEEYRRITRQYKELRKKFKHFQQVDAEKYIKIWNMNDIMVKDILKKVADADRVIHDQILQISWKELEFDTRTPPHLSNIETKEGDSSLHGRRSVASMSTYSHSNHDQLLSQFSPSQKLNIFNLLINQGSFLIEKPLLEKLDMIPDEQHTMYKIDSIFHSLGVEDMEEVEEIIALYYDENGQMIVPENNVLDVLRNYLVNRSENQNQKKTGKKAAQSSIRERAREKRYWTHMNGIIPEPKQRCWKLLKMNLESYHSLLKERSEIMFEVDEMREQNMELRKLLADRLDEDINHQLKVPPSKVIDLSVLQ